MNTFSSAVLLDFYTSNLVEKSLNGIIEINSNGLCIQTWTENGVIDYVNLFISIIPAPYSNYVIVRRFRKHRIV